ncbi:MAG: hypothetical protein KBF43_03280 [Dermatophilaceae bacterium]|nr:hypothetical protein [Dermatophilaceae bacterium]MBP9917588.1 hypothetical protein [Dermatophilaceae bacterium]
MTQPPWDPNTPPPEGLPPAQFPPPGAAPPPAGPPPPPPGPLLGDSGPNPYAVPPAPGSSVGAPSPRPGSGQLSSYIGGAVLGLVGSFVIVYAAIVSGVPILAPILTGVFIVGAIIVLATKNLRTMGSGLLGGIAIGLIIFAGSCGGFLALILSGY